MRIGACVELGEVVVPPAGLDYIEPRVSSLLMCDKDDEDFAPVASAVQAATIKPEAVNCFFPGSLPNTGPEVNPIALDAWVSITCRRAAAVGVGIIVFGSGGSRRVQEGFSRDKAREQIVDNLKRYGPIAAENGVTIALESLSANDCNFITTVDEAADIVRSVNHPNIRVLADTYHMATDGEGPGSISRAGELIVHVHCAEADGRGPLGTVGEDQRPYFRALKDVGYDGRISMECKWNDLPAQLVGGTAELLRQWQTA